MNFKEALGRQSELIEALEARRGEARASTLIRGTQMIVLMRTSCVPADLFKNPLHAKVLKKFLDETQQLAIMQTALAYEPRLLELSPVETSEVIETVVQEVLMLLKAISGSLAAGLKEDFGGPEE
jgi:hypothetical protein